ncbi:MAG: MBG domain-containing protein, partial [Xanthobacteraceae bacterium]
TSGVAGSPYTLTVAGTLSDQNYTVTSTVNGSWTVTPATLTLTANGFNKQYGDTYTFAGTEFSTSGLVNGDTVSTVSLTSGGAAATATVAGGPYAIAVSNAQGNGLGNYTISYHNGTLTVTPVTLYYVATPVQVPQDSQPPTLTGTVTGFVLSDTQANATTGTLQWTTTATSSSNQGAYPIYGSGLSANFGDYVFAQAAGNATALTVGTPLPSNNPPSYYTPPNNSNSQNNTSISFSNAGNTGPIHVFFTPNGQNTANNQGNNDQGNNANPASLPPGDAFTHNNGFDYQPISQYDANQYSDFKAPDYDDDDSEATIFTILARAASPGHGGDYMIDNFWNGTGDTWPGAGHINLLDKVTFSDGTGHDVTPTNDDAFPIMPGKTDFAALLKNGPVMIGGPAGQTPAQWLLATGLTPDGKDIVCDDPISGTVVELAYNPATDTVGGIASIFDANSKGFVSLADAGNDIPAGTAGGLAALQSFTPSTYYAVTVH